MAKETYYFSHDSNAITDTKILNMRADYGLEGYGLFWVLIEMMRNEENYKLELSKNTYRAIKTLTNTSIDVEEFIKNCIEDYKIFIEDNGYFYSNSLLSRMSEMERKKEINRKNGKLGGRPKKETQEKPNGFETETEKKPNGFEKETQEKPIGFEAETKINQNKIKKNKIKENKKNIEKEKINKKEKLTEIDCLINQNFSDDELKNTIYEFIKMRKAIKKPLTTRGLELMIKKLYKLTTNVDEQVEILNNSIMNNWQGIYPLKQEKQKNGINDFKELWEEANNEQKRDNTGNNSFSW